MGLLIFVLVVVLLFLSVVGSGLGGSTFWELPSDPRFHPQNDTSADNPVTPVTVHAEAAAADVGPGDTEAALAEAGLAARLMAGQISAAEYRQMMAQLAAAEAIGRPIVVPPERSP